MRYVSMQVENYMRFFYACANIIYFDGFSVGADRSMVGIENTSNYCFLSSLLHCVLNCNDIRNFLFDHYKCNAGLISHNSKFFILEPYNIETSK